MRANQQKAVFSGAAKSADDAAIARYFAVLKGVSPEIGTRWRSGVDSNSRFRLFSAKSGNFLYFPSSRESPRAVSGGKGRPYDGRVAILLCDGFHRLRTVRPVTPTASLRVSAVDGLGVANELVCTGRRAGEAGEARRDWTRLMGEGRIGHGLTSAFQLAVQAADRSGVLRGRAGTHELARRHNLSRNLDLDPRPHALSISAGLSIVPQLALVWRSSGTSLG